MPIINFLLYNSFVPYIATASGQLVITVTTWNWFSEKFPVLFRTDTLK